MEGHAALRRSPVRPRRAKQIALRDSPLLQVKRMAKHVPQTERKHSQPDRCQYKPPPLRSGRNQGEQKTGERAGEETPKQQLEHPALEFNPSACKSEREIGKRATTKANSRYLRPNASCSSRSHRLALASLLVTTLPYARYSFRFSSKRAGIERSETSPSTQQVAGDALPALAAQSK